MHCESNGCHSGRKPCPTPRECGAYSYLGGGNYQAALDAENTYLHLREEEPVFALRNDHDEFTEEPMSDFAVACWWAAGAFAAFIVAAGFVDWLMSF